MKIEFNHVPVLLNETIENLNIKENGIYVDGTLGGAGHSFEIAKRLDNSGKLIGIDKDVEALEKAKDKLSKFNNIEFVQDNHDNLRKILENLNIKGVDGILLDLGISSYQIDNGQRGFSYMKDAQLDMRMDLSQTKTAKTIVNTYTEQMLANVIYKYGEERFSRQIAKKIVEARKIRPINTTFELVEIIKAVIPNYAKSKEGHPAKKTFQAIRIETNNEIEPLYQLVIDAINSLNNGGRLCIITFHSLEDRAVKMAYQDAVGKCTCPPDLPYCVCGKKELGKIITKKPIIPTDKEMKNNSRSKSAKLRVFERIIKD